MRPEVAVTEFLYAHEYAEKSQRWYQGMLGLFAAFCAAESAQNKTGTADQADNTDTAEDRTKAPKRL